MNTSIEKIKRSGSIFSNTDEIKNQPEYEKSSKGDHHIDELVMKFY
jgi:hypothetical protein